jgi:hypothetical protein
MRFERSIEGDRCPQEKYRLPMPLIAAVYPCGGQAVP